MDDSAWYKNRKYLHFDCPIGIDKASKIVKNPAKVACHSFLPLLSYKIEAKKIYKENGSIKTKVKTRPIAFASHVDSHIYSYYCKLLSNLYEDRIRGSSIDSCVLAFRALGKNNIHFARDAFNVIRSRGACSAIGLDISGFFDNIDHEILKQCWLDLLEVKNLPPDHYAVFKAITKYSTVSRDDLYKLLGISVHNPPKSKRRICSISDFRNTVRQAGLVVPNKLSIGIPQGSPISAFLSNLYMYKFDKVISAAVQELGGVYFRYCDDMLVVIGTEWRDKVAGFIRDEIKNLKIDINPKKTEIRNFHLSNGRLVSDKPLQYLGFLFNGSQILVRSSSLARYSERMRRGVNLAKKVKIKRNRLRIAKGYSALPVFKRKIYENYSHLGKRNFVRYGLRAAEIMNSSDIRKQLKPLWKRLVDQIEG